MSLRRVRPGGRTRKSSRPGKGYPKTKAAHLPGPLPDRIHTHRYVRAGRPTHMHTHDGSTSGAYTCQCGAHVCETCADGTTLYRRCPTCKAEKKALTDFHSGQTQCSACRAVKRRTNEPGRRKPMPSPRMPTDCPRCDSRLYVIWKYDPPGCLICGWYAYRYWRASMYPEAVGTVSRARERQVRGVEVLTSRFGHPPIPVTDDWIRIAMAVQQQGLASYALLGQWLGIHRQTLYYRIQRARNENPTMPAL